MEMADAAHVDSPLGDHTSFVPLVPYAEQMLQMRAALESARPYVDGWGEDAPNQDDRLEPLAKIDAALAVSAALADVKPIA